MLRPELGPGLGRLDVDVVAKGSFLIGGQTTLSHAGLLAVDG